MMVYLSHEADGQILLLILARQKSDTKQLL